MKCFSFLKLNNSPLHHQKQNEKKALHTSSDDPRKESNKEVMVNEKKCNQTIEKKQHREIEKWES